LLPASIPSKICCGECGVSTGGRKIRGLWDNRLCEKCGEEDDEEEEIDVDDVDAPNIFPYKKCCECGERSSCGNYNDDKQWFCEDCYEEDDEEKEWSETRKALEATGFTMVKKPWGWGIVKKE
jgi:hypothetical protein